jgi:hypothetical protein
MPWPRLYLMQAPCLALSGAGFACIFAHLFRPCTVRKKPCNPIFDVLQFFNCVSALKVLYKKSWNYETMKVRQQADCPSTLSVICNPNKFSSPERIQNWSVNWKLIPWKTVHDSSRFLLLLKQSNSRSVRIKGTQNVSLYQGEQMCVSATSVHRHKPERFLLLHLLLWGSLSPCFLGSR